MMETPPKYEIFISYRRDGGVDYARMIYLELKGRGYNTFFDFNSLRSGKFNENIFKAIDECRYFILVLSNGALDRCVNEDDWVRHEIEYALSKGKEIIPICPSGCMRGFPETMPESFEPLRHIQISRLEMDDLFDKSFDKIVEDRFDADFREGRSPIATGDVVTVRSFKKIGIGVIAAIVFAAVAIGAFVTHGNAAAERRAAESRRLSEEARERAEAERKASDEARERAREEALAVQREKIRLEAEAKAKAAAEEELRKAREEQMRLAAEAEARLKADAERKALEEAREKERERAEAERKSLEEAREKERETVLAAQREKIRLEAEAAAKAAAAAELEKVRMEKIRLEEEAKAKEKTSKELIAETEARIRAEAEARATRKNPLLSAQDLFARFRSMTYEDIVALHNSPEGRVRVQTLDPNGNSFSGTEIEAAISALTDQTVLVALVTNGPPDLLKTTFSLGHFSVETLDALAQDLLVRPTQSPPLDDRDRIVAWAGKVVAWANDFIDSNPAEQKDHQLAQSDEQFSTVDADGDNQNDDDFADLDELLAKSGHKSFQELTQELATARPIVPMDVVRAKLFYQFYDYRGFKRRILKYDYELLKRYAKDGGLLEKQLKDKLYKEWGDNRFYSWNNGFDLSVEETNSDDGRVLPPHGVLMPGF